MPACSNCGTEVSRDYARVFTPNGVENPRCCPNCPDKIRVNGKVRDARATRQGPSSMDEGQLDDDQDDEEFAEALT